ncbi:Exodeoxyribonuclease VII small subunit [Desulfosporosinus acidiphilus SJ4]|uniref:Exodeoxyribonuclease 7 small subunit n=2 Tax=Desulfosporosinus TaxID=79206 RepID=I4D8V7_DESAJ|nr:Exodeoxyribonuclease VII small subunit [Desulfosporosinus acidiphilus SJ4]
MAFEEGKGDFSEGLADTINMNILEGNETISLESGFERLESIVKALEQKDLPLEKALEYFKVGVALVQHCSTVLNQAEKQMQVLLEDPDGQLQYQPVSYDVKG